MLLLNDHILVRSIKIKFYWFIAAFIYLFIHLFICLFIYLLVYLFIYFER